MASFCVESLIFKQTTAEYLYAKNVFVKIIYSSEKLEEL